MSDKSRSGTTREERLKQALKANIARRKAQAKARSQGDEAEPRNAAGGKEQDEQNG
ncbi:MAG: hypothetical protein ACU0DK_16025 [Pseudooceanicola sp.]